MYDLLKFIENEYKQKKLDRKQIPAIGRDILKIKELTSERTKQIANRIAFETFKNAVYEERRGGAPTLGINEQNALKEELKNQQQFFKSEVKLTDKIKTQLEERGITEEVWEILSEKERL